MNQQAYSPADAKKAAALYRKVQAFWNSGRAAATIGGLPFTRFSASRHLSLNGVAVGRYLEGLAAGKADALRRKAPIGDGILQ